MYTYTHIYIYICIYMYTRICIYMYSTYSGTSICNAILYIENCIDLYNHRKSLHYSEKSPTARTLYWNPAGIEPII